MNEDDVFLPAEVLHLRALLVQKVQKLTQKALQICITFELELDVIR